MVALFPIRSIHRIAQSGHAARVSGVPFAATNSACSWASAYQPNDVSTIVSRRLRCSRSGQDHRKKKSNRSSFLIFAGSSLNKEISLSKSSLLVATLLPTPTLSDPPKEHHHEHTKYLGRKLTFDDFPNFKRKLVVQHIPLAHSTDEIMHYFF